MKAYQETGSARFQRPKKRAPDGAPWAPAIALAGLNLCHLPASVSAKGKILPLPHADFHLHHPPTLFKLHLILWSYCLLEASSGTPALPTRSSPLPAVQELAFLPGAGVIV